LKFSSVGLVAGLKHYEDMVDLKKYEEWDKAKLQSNFRMWEFSPAMNELLGAADVVVSRAGMTTIAELATLGKPVILVPFEKLPGSHQMKNAERLERENAAIVVPDAEMVEKPEVLLNAIKTLIRSPKKREELSAKLREEAKSDAAARLADILIENAGKA
jgi:UDP-N-acetylglucosamine--N-acetylmuramyl-(pentapeptide) pyrophosphoryl-undecaprenol N-acetylglucosamine transferase